MTPYDHLSRGPGLRQRFTDDVDHRFGIERQLSTEDAFSDANCQHAQILLDIFVRPQRLHTSRCEQLSHRSQPTFTAFGRGLIAQPLRFVSCLAEDFVGLRSRVKRIRVDRRLFSVAKTAF